MKKIAWAALLLAVTTGPSSSASYNDLNAGIAYLNDSAWANAVTWLSKAIDAGDLLPDQMRVARLDRAQAQLNLNHVDLAITDYSAILASRPDDPEFLVYRALAYASAGKLDEAAADCDNLVAVRPVLSDAYTIRAIINAKRGQLDKVRQDLKKILALLPENSVRSTATGIIEWQVGDLPAANDNFHYAATHGRGNIYGWLWYALTEVRRGEAMPRRALPDFDKTRWPGAVVSVYLGEGTPEAAFAAAGQGESDAVKAQTCEANFYIGELLWQRHDAGAKPLLAKAASDCPMDFMEWSPAILDLAGLP